MCLGSLPETQAAPLAERNDASGGTVPPPPPGLDIDPLELHTEYLEYIGEKVDGAVPEYGWLFTDHSSLVKHFEALERLVEEMRREKVSSGASPAQDEERFGHPSPSTSATKQARRKRKRAQHDDRNHVEDEAPGAAAALIDAQSQPQYLHALALRPKKRKVSRIKADSSAPTPSEKAERKEQRTSQGRRQGCRRREQRAC